MARRPSADRRRRKRHRHHRFSPQLHGIDRVRAVDRATVAFDLRHSGQGFLDQPLADLPILPKHLWANRPAGLRIPPGLPVGSGPYRLTSHSSSKGYTFSANRNYFRGRPKVDRIRVRLVRGGARTIGALERGDVDVVPTGVTAATEERLGTGPEIAVRRGVNYTGTALALNLRGRAPFDRLSTRRAVARALDPERIADAVGHVPATLGFLHRASRWRPGSGLPRAAERAPRRDMNRLRNLPIEVLAPEDNPARMAVGRQVVAALRRAGAKAVLNQVPRRAFNRALGGDASGAGFQAAVAGIPPLASYDPDYLRTVFGAGARLNQTGYRSIAFDHLAERVARTSDRRARLRAVAAELRQLARDVPSVPLTFSQGGFAYRSSAYDGWVSVKGTGALDKRSFLASERPGATARPAGVTPSGDSGGDVPRQAFVLASIGLLFVAVALLGVALRRRRSDGR